MEIKYFDVESVVLATELRKSLAVNIPKKVPTNVIKI